MRHYDRLLFKAAINNEPDEIILALENKANPSAQCTKGNNPLHYAAKHGSADALRELLKNVSEIFLILNDKHETCLHTAAYYGSYECAQIIMDFDAHALIRCFQIKNTRNKTPLDMCYDVLTQNLIRDRILQHYEATR